MWCFFVADDTKEFYPVEKILKKRYKKDGSTEYRVKWQGYGRAHNEWVKETALSREALEIFNRKKWVYALIGLL